MNPHLTDLLNRTEAVMAGRANGWQPSEAVLRASPAPAKLAPAPRLHVGVDLGTAYTVLTVLDEHYQPVAGAYQFAQIVRDGLVVDFAGAVELLTHLKHRVEATLGCGLTSAASAYPPGVPQAEVRATAHVLNAAGLECSGLIAEPEAANNVLRIRDGAIVDVGGGTTGIAVFRDGQCVYTADEATGGTHFSLVITGAKELTFEQAEELKKDPRVQAQLLPIVRPVMEKVGSIIRRHAAGHAVETLYLVGGTCAFAGMDRVIAEYTGIKTIVPGKPLFVTPLGIAMHNP